MLSRRSRDICGLACVALGLLSAFSIWMSVVGTVGVALDTVFTYLFGLLRVTVPVWFTLVGILVVRGRNVKKVRSNNKGRQDSSKGTKGRQGRQGSKDRHTSDPSNSLKNPVSSKKSSTSASKSTRRESLATPKHVYGKQRGDAQLSQVRSHFQLSLGASLCMVAALAALHIFRGRPDVSAGVEALGAAGGVIGAAVGWVLYNYLDVVGSSIFIAFLMLVGIMLTTPLTLSVVAVKVFVWTQRTFKLLWRSCRRFYANLFELYDNVKQSPQPATQREVFVNSDVLTSVEAPTGVPSIAAPSVAASPKTDAHAAHLMPAGSAGVDAVPAGSAGVDANHHTVPADANVSLEHDDMRWHLPSPLILSVTESRQVNLIEVDARGKLLRATLAQFGVETKLLDPVVGPTVTRFVLELGEGVKVAKLESLRKDIAYAMASPDVRILAPIPGQRAIGVEVPNLNRHVVSLGDVLGSLEACAAVHPLEVAVGLDINGSSIMMNLAATPHLLIAGATGAGKSSCLNSIITSVLMRTTPDEVRMILVDPKRVEMGQYENVPHLLTSPVTDPRKAANALAWAVREMERRYDVLHDTGFRDITGYNTAVSRGELVALAGQRDRSGAPVTYRHMPFVLVIVDELADLMMVAARDVEESIARLAQMARAVGIHLVIATQRPSVNVITGLIKANIPTRFAFSVSSITDSRVILDQAGAERLLGKGDMLMVGTSSSTPHRVQGCWVTEKEVKSVVEHWVAQEPEFFDDPSVATEIEIENENAQPSAHPSSATQPKRELHNQDSIGIQDSGGGHSGDGQSKDDELIGEAIELVVRSQLGSTSMLQRKLRVGFARAGRIMDMLEERGIVGPSAGSKAREVLVTVEDLEGDRS